MKGVGCSLIFLLALIPARFVSAQTVVNGDFENVVISPGVISSSASQVPGWTRSGAPGDGLLVRVGYSDSDGSVTVAGHGNQFVILGGGQSGPATASWTTTVTNLTVGATYSLSFMIANEGEASSQSITVSFPAGSLSAAQSFSTTPITPGPGQLYWKNWETKTRTFVATATSATLQFSTINQQYDIGLDYVQVSGGGGGGSLPTVTTVQLSRSDTNSNCTAPPPVTSFRTADVEIWIYLSVTNAQASGVLRIDWVDPNGTVKFSDPYPPLASSGSFCFTDYLSTAGQPYTPAAGNWTVRFYWNGSPLTSLAMPIAAAGGGGSGITLDLQRDVLQPLNLAPGTYTDPSVLASKGLMIVANGPGTPGAAGTGTLRVEAVGSNEVHPPGTTTEAFFLGPGVAFNVLNCTTLAWTGAGSLTGFSITRPGQRNGGSTPAWAMFAYDAFGTQLSTTGEGNLATGNFLQLTNFASFTLSSATPIARVVFCSHNGSSTYNSLPLSGSNGTVGGGGGGTSITGTYICSFGPFPSGTVTLTQNGTTVTGTLPNGGTVIGTVTVTTITITLIGTWTSNLGTGTIILIWNGNTLTGTWTRGTGTGDPGGAPATGTTGTVTGTKTPGGGGGSGGGGGPTSGGACRIDITSDKNTPVNLTTEGTADWYFMGLNYPPTGCQTGGTISGPSICTPALRKSGGSLLSNLTFFSSVASQTGYVHLVGGGERSSTWNDGAPRQSGTEGGATAIEHGGFKFTAPADQQQRTLMVHVGGVARDPKADWTLTAHIDGLPDQTITQVMGDKNDTNYKIVYQAPAGGGPQIAVSLQVNHAYDEVTFQAVALSLPVQGSGCNGTGGGGGTITLPPPSPPIGPGGGNGSVTATPPAGTTTVMAIPSVPWITIITVVGGTVTYSVPPNPGDARIGVITISAPGAIPANLPVAQNGANAGTGAGGCTYPLQSNTLQTFDVNGKIPSGGSTGLVRFLTAQTCTWTATVVYPLGAATDWITVLPPGNSGVGNGAISFTVAVNATGNARMGAIVVQGQVTLILQDGGIAPPPPGTPVIASGGILNAASYAPGGPPNGLAQGSFFSLFGTSLGPDQFVQAGYPIPTTLGGVSVQIISGGNTYNAYLVFVSAGQINGLIPSNVPIGNAQVTVTYNGKASAFASIVVSATSFGVFFQAVNGNNLAVAQNVATATDYPLNLPTVPAKPGQIVILWGTGLGAFKGPDNLAPNVNDDRPNLQVSITVGGLSAQRLYAGRQAQSAGVDNIYFTLPLGVPLGCNVPVLITAGGIAANGTTLAISADGSPCQ